MDEVQALDVADYLIASGVVREGHSPTGPGPYAKILIGVLAFIVIAVISLVVVVIWFVRRSIRRRQVVADVGETSTGGLSD